MVDRIAALGDPTRRQIFELLAAEPSSVSDLARRLPVTRPAVSQHLRVLRNAGLVVHHAAGTRHVYRVDPQGVAALRDYLDSLWATVLEQFKSHAEQLPSGRKEKRR
jgi:DNA-binding transcriptional ArsR family regulator